MWIVFAANMISESKDLFKNNGGDTQILLDKCKMCYAQRVFTLKREDYERKQITKADINKAMKMFKQTKESDDTDKMSREIMNAMYA